MRGCGRVAVAGLLGALTCAAATAGDLVPNLIFQGGGARDVAVSPNGETLYIALYESNEVLALDAANGAILRRARLFGGPSSIVANENSLAVLNRAAATVAIMATADFSIAATVPVSEGTSFLFSAGPSRIGTVNPLKNEVGIIGPALTALTSTVHLTDAIPVGAAQAGAYIAVIGRAPDLVWLLDASSLEVLARAELSASPRFVARTDNTAVVVAAGSSLLTLDLPSMKIARSRVFSVSSLTASREGLVCTADGQVFELSPTLDAVSALPLPEGAAAARASGTALIAWAPTLGRVWRLARSTGDTGLSLPPAGAQVPSVLAKVLVNSNVSAEEMPSTESAAAPEVVAPPAVDLAASAPANSVDAAPASDAVPPTPDASEVSPPQEAKKSKAEYRFTVKPRHLRLGGFQPYPPRFGDPTGRTFEEELSRALDFNKDKDSLAHIDFNQPLEDLVVRDGTAIRGAGQGPDTKLEWTGGVDFFVDRIHVTGDHLEYSATPGQLIIEGDAKLHRGDSTLSADRIRAFDAFPPAPPGLWPLIPSRSRAPIRHPLVPSGYKDRSSESSASLGAIEMTGIAWDEPERHLTADSFDINSVTRAVDIDHPEGRAGPLIFGGQSLRLRGADGVYGEGLWVTTCDEPTPHYRIRLSEIETKYGETLEVTGARLQLGKHNTPLYVPRLGLDLAPGERRIGTELDLGGASSLGSYLNVAQWFAVNQSLSLAPRVYATAKAGTGIGLDGRYNYMDDPASPMFRSKGEFHTLYTTQENGYTHWYHRQELTPDTVVLGQIEQWYKKDFLKDFYREQYENRAGPRSFLNVTHSEDEFLASATVAPSLHGFTHETVKLPEVSFDLFERQLGAGFYGTFDSAAGLYETRPDSIQAVRTVTVGRLSRPLNVAPGFNILPFAELEGTYYSDTLTNGSDAFRGTTTFGVTAQSRFQKSFAGIGHFNGFKHLIIPSATLSYRPDATLAAADSPRFDALDSRPGRLRIESTIDNIVLGRNAATNEVWPVTQLTLYGGRDIENQAVRSNDYELQFQVRPRPTWGLQAVGELHQLNETPGLPGADFSRVLTYIFYDDRLGKNRMNGRVGFAYTSSADNVLNQEVLYGAGYRISEHWSAGFEQRYDFERDKLTRQTYSVRRKLHDWEVEFGIGTRRTGLDVVLKINLVNFPQIGL